MYLVQTLATFMSDMHSSTSGSEGTGVLCQMKYLVPRAAAAAARAWWEARTKKNVRGLCREETCVFSGGARK